MEQLKAPIRASLASDSEEEFSEVVLDATNRQGKPMRVKVTCTRLANPDGRDPQGVILLMEETDGRTNDPSQGEGER